MSHPAEPLLGSIPHSVSEASSDSLDLEVEWVEELEVEWVEELEEESLVGYPEKNCSSGLDDSCHSLVHVDFLGCVYEFVP